MPTDIRQTHFRFGKEELLEATHGWYQNEDVNHSQSITADWAFLLRFCEQESGGTAALNTDAQFQYNRNGLGWNNITTTSTVVKAVASVAFTNGQACTKRLSGTGTFETSGAGCTEDGNSGGPANDIVASGNSETEAGLRIVFADVATGDTIQFRFTSPDWTVTYTVTPTLTIGKLQVVASSDDAHRMLDPDGYSPWSLIRVNVAAGNFGAGTSGVGCGMRFTNVFIPQGANITTAYLTFRSSQTVAGTVVNSRISAEDVDDAPTFADSAATFDTRYAARTTARIDWDGIPAWTSGVNYNSPSITTVIQEIVDRAGWVSGNDIVIFWDDFDARSTAGSDTFRYGDSYDGYPTYAPKLTITYTPSTVSYQTLASTAIGTAVLATALIFAKALSAISLGVSALSRLITFTKSLASVSIGVGVLGKVSTFLRSLSPIASGVATLSAVTTFVKVLASTALGTAVLTTAKMFISALSAISLGVASLTKAPIFVKALAAVSLGVSTLSRVTTFVKTLDPVSIGVAVLSTVTTFYRTLAPIAVGTALLSTITTFYRSLVASTTASPVLTTIRTAIQSLIATVIGVATITRTITFSKALSATATAISSLTAAFIKVITLGGTATVLANLTKIATFYKTLPATAIGAAVLTAARFFSQALNSVTLGVAALTRANTFYRTLAGVTSGVAVFSLVKTFSRSLVSIANGIASLTQLSTHYLTLAVSAIGITVINIGRFLTLTATALGTAVLTAARFFSQALNSVVQGITSLSWHFDRILSLLINAPTRGLVVTHKFSRGLRITITTVEK